MLQCLSIVIYEKMILDGGLNQIDNAEANFKYDDDLLLVSA